MPQTFSIQLPLSFLLHIVFWQSLQWQHLISESQLPRTVVVMIFKNILNRCMFQNNQKILFMWCNTMLAGCFCPFTATTSTFSWQRLLSYHVPKWPQSLCWATELASYTWKNKLNTCLLNLASHWGDSTVFFFETLLACLAFIIIALL